MAKADYVRLMKAAYPTATARQIVTLLAARGIDCTPEHVRRSLKRPSAEPKKFKNAARSERIRRASVTPDALGRNPCGQGLSHTSLQLTPAPQCVGASF